MVRYTFALRGPSKDPASDLLIIERHVNLRQGEQNTEEYLCSINPRGQVPVLVGNMLAHPVADSLAITLYLADMFPSLMPSAHEADIKYLLRELHALNYFSLSFTGQHSMLTNQVREIEQKISGDISSKYKDALEYKLKVFQESKIGGLEPEVVQDMMKRTRSLLEDVDRLLVSTPMETSTERLEGQWLWGLSQPTALDAHFIAFIARMMDVNRQDLVPKRLMRYAVDAMGRKEWRDITGGRKTMQHG